MVRPTNCRRIAQGPTFSTFRPCGDGRTSEEALPDFVTITLDEFEAVRLTDLEGLYQADAADLMGVSRPTLSRIIESAHNKIARALVLGLELRIEGGTVFHETGATHDCPACKRKWRGPDSCPHCRKAQDAPDNVKVCPKRNSCTKTCHKEETK